MSSEEIGSGEKDFYTQLMAEIEAGKVGRAVEMIMTLEGYQLQTETLSQLVGELDHALDIRGASTLDLGRARALLRVRDRAHELASTLDLDHAHAVEQALERGRVIYLYLDRADQINRTIIGCLNVMMDKDQSSSAGIARVMAKPSVTHKRKSGRIIIMVLLSILICIAVAWVLMLQVKNSIP